MRPPNAQPAPSRLAGLAALSLLLLAGCGEPTLPPTRGYLVISLDTLRADHLSSYGYQKPTSPFLDDLAEGGTLFENAISQYPSTLTSHMSVFTGLYPQQHSVFPPDRILSPELATLPEAFRAAGYRTAGFTEGGLMEGRYGFVRGFDEFSDVAAKVPRDLEVTLERGRDFLRSLGNDEPFFLFLHTYSVHAPYVAPEPWGQTFWDGPPPEGVPVPTGRQLLRFNRRGTREAQPWMPFYISQYDGLISYTDAQLMAFFAELDESGLSDDLTVVVLSDHGEEFLDHGFLAHGQIYDETVRVPLIIRHPSIDGGARVRQLVELLDVTPTLYDLADIDPPHTLSGQSLVPMLTGKASMQDREEAFAQVAASRSLYHREGDRLLQLVVTRHDANEWLGRWATFDLEPGQDSFSIRSFEEPRRISYRVDGGRWQRTSITPEWRQIALGDPTRETPIRVNLVAQDCSSIALQRQRCFSMQVRDPAPQRVELFDLTEDRSSTTDLSRSERELAQRLLRRLGEYRFESLGEPTVVPPDEELQQRLEALGYVD